MAKESRAKGEEEVQFEAALERLEEIVARLEGQATLEESMALFEEGMRLSARCRELLEQAEGKIEKLVEKAGGALGREPVGQPAEEE